MRHQNFDNDYKAPTIIKPKDTSIIENIENVGEINMNEQTIMQNPIPEGENQPVVNIKTDSYNENKLLVIKDSYANAYIPFLCQHYSEITMLDMRYIDVPYDEVINTDDYNQVLFLYNYSTFAQDKNIRKLDF